MTLSIEGFATDILARLATAKPNMKVYESEIPEDQAITYTNGVFSPFVVIYFGGPIRSAQDHGLVSTRQDTTLVYCTLDVYSPKAADSRRIKDSMVNLFTGFSPTDCGEMILEGGLSYSRTSNTVRPTQYIASTAWTARSNLSWTE